MDKIYDIVLYGATLIGVIGLTIVVFLALLGG